LKVLDKASPVVLEEPAPLFKLSPVMVLG